MCGIVGSWGGREVVSAERFDAALATLAHRGPDARGVWSDQERGLHLGHTRLSILDLSAAGAQPMRSRSGRYVVVYNGEVYNHQDLRDELPGPWRGHSDTETLLAAIEAWGLEKTLQRCVGMFALALWDRHEGRLQLARDRVGIKPLFYGSLRGRFVFASELKPIRRLAPAGELRVDPEALSLFLRFGFVPAPWSIYAGLKKLLPGSIVSVNSRGEPQEPQRYWSASEVVERGRAAPFAGDLRAAGEELERLMRDAVAIRTLSDVPLGALLSGGVDSSLVVALLQQVSSRPVRTFSIGFKDAAYNEAEHAKRVAQHLGTDHTELYLSSADALETIPLLPQIADEPFADSSLIPTLLVSRLARQHVKVALTGDGGDEVWAGYDRYLWGERVWRVLRGVPSPLRRLGARALALPSAAHWDGALRHARRVLPWSPNVQQLGHKVHKLANLAHAGTPDDFHLALASLGWQDPQSLLLERREDPARRVFGPAPEGLGLVERMQLRDLQMGFPDDMLTKVDRASMAVSLEARVPLADHRLFEFAATLPQRAKLRAGTTKWLPRQLLYRFLDRTLIDRPKMGFGIPLLDWLRGPLRDWSTDLLDSQLLQEAGLRPEPIEGAHAQLLKGRPFHPQIWTILAYTSWLRAQNDKGQPTPMPGEQLTHEA